MYNTLDVLQMDLDAFFLICDIEFHWNCIIVKDSQKRILPMKLEWYKKFSLEIRKCIISGIKMISGKFNEWRIKSKKKGIDTKMQPYSFIFLRSSFIAALFFCEWVVRFQGNPNANSNKREIVMCRSISISSVTEYTFLICRRKKNAVCSWRYEINVTFSVFSLTHWDKTSFTGNSFDDHAHWKIAFH